MCIRRLVPLLLPLLAMVPASAKKPDVAATARGENQDVVVYVTLYATPGLVKEVLGNDLGGHYIVAAVKVEPKYGKEVAIDRDDFLLRTDKDGEKAKPFAPTQIAGSGALVIRQTAEGGRALGQGNGPRLGGGIPGTIGGPLDTTGNGGSIGNGGEGNVGSAEARADNGSNKPEDPILKVLREKVLAEKKTEQPVTGLLYFPMEKQKVKDLELYYGAKDTLIRMRFK